MANTNSNYPDGTWAGDPSAPWNQPEQEELVCGDCRFRADYPHWNDVEKWFDSVCVYDADEVMGVNCYTLACDSWEEN